MAAESRVARKRADQPFDPATHKEAPAPPKAPDAPMTDDRDAELEWLLNNPVHLGIDPALKALQDFSAARAAGPPRRTRRPYLLAFGAVLVAILLVVGAVAFVNRSHRSSHDRAITGAPTSAQVDTASGWAARELTHHARILADSKSRAVLVADGFDNVIAGTANAGGAELSFDYVLATPALRTSARSNGAVARALHSSVPIAVFGTGKQQVIVRQVHSGSIHRVQTSRASVAIRRSAGRQLLANPALHVVGAARTVLQTGGLDFRAATVLAVMAGSAHVSILSINVSQPEHAAGLPARSMDVRPTQQRPWKQS